MSRKFVILQIFVALLLSQSALGQVNFFTNDSQDSLVTNFYQRNKKASLFAVTNLPSMQVGVVCLYHNGDNRVSYYFEAKSNFSHRYIIEGQECYGEGVREKEVAYTASSLNIGLARGFTRNWFIYGGVGLVVKHTHYENEVENNYRYNVTNDGVWFNFVGGAMYVTDNNLSFLVGLDMYDRSLTAGIGYTF